MRCIHCKHLIVKVTNYLLVSTVGRNSINFNVLCHIWVVVANIHDLTMTLYAPSLKMYARIN